jgi:hypothetical protein
MKRTKLYEDTQRGTEVDDDEKERERIWALYITGEHRRA